MENHLLLTALKFLLNRLFKQDHLPEGVVTAVQNCLDLLLSGFRKGCLLDLEPQGGPPAPG